MIRMMMNIIFFPSLGGGEGREGWGGVNVKLLGYDNRREGGELLSSITRTVLG